MNKVYSVFLHHWNNTNKTDTMIKCHQGSLQDILFKLFNTGNMSKSLVIRDVIHSRNGGKNRYADTLMQHTIALATIVDKFYLRWGQLHPESIATLR